MDPFSGPDADPIILMGRKVETGTGLGTAPANCRKLRLPTSPSDGQDGYRYLTLSLVNVVARLRGQPNVHDVLPAVCSLK